MRLSPVTALEGIHEGMEGLRSQSAAVETLVEAATRVDSQKEGRQDHEDRADDNGLSEHKGGAQGQSTPWYHCMRCNSAEVCFRLYHKYV